MSTTWANFKNLVRAAYSDGAVTANQENAAIQAVADYVKAAIERETNGDLQARQSYLTAYREQKFKLAGYTIVSNFATVLAAVQTRITVDGNRDSIGNYVSAQVQQGIDDFNSGAILYYAVLIEAVADLQRYIDYYRSRHTTYYTATDFDETGDASVAAMPDGARPWRFVYQTYYSALAESVAYAADDYVESNGRVYQVVTGGTIGVGQLGAGLTSTDPDATETLAGLVFQYQDDPVCFSRVMTPVAWKTREVLSCNDCSTLTDADFADYTPDDYLALRSSAYLYSLEPRGTAFWVWPKVRSYWKVQLEWDGIKTSFLDADVVRFEESEARAVVYYIKSILHRSIFSSHQESNTYMLLYNGERRKLWAQRDSQRREYL